MTVNFSRTACDSAETEKARLLTADRLSESRTAVMSSFSASASSDVMTGATSGFFSYKTGQF